MAIVHPSSTMLGPALVTMRPLALEKGILPAGCDVAHLSGRNGGKILAELAHHVMSLVSNRHVSWPIIAEARILWIVTT